MTATLTPRQRHILTTVQAAPSLKEAAERLGMTKGGVRGCMSVIRRVVGPLDTDVPPEETRAEVDARIAREIAAGIRCRVCWLRVPCCDHVSF